MSYYEYYYFSITLNGIFDKGEVTKSTETVKYIIIKTLIQYVNIGSA